MLPNSFQSATHTIYAKVNIQYSHQKKGNWEPQLLLLEFIKYQTSISTLRKSAQSAGAVEFIAIAPRSTLTRIGCTWLGPIYGSNRTFWLLDSVQVNDLC